MKRGLDGPVKISIRYHSVAPNGGIPIMAVHRWYRPILLLPSKRSGRWRRKHETGANFWQCEFCSVHDRGHSKRDANLNARNVRLEQLIRRRLSLDCYLLAA